MSEQKMIEAFQEALGGQGIEDQVIAVGQFNPRGHSGGMVAGAMVGGDAGGIAGAAGEVAGSVAGIAGGELASSVARGLPPNVLIGVSEDAVYGFEGIQSKVGGYLFQEPREGLVAKVHQRIDVKVLELIPPDGSAIELEGNRLPITHSKDVFEELAPGD